MEATRLVHMANQIADFFDAYPEEEAIAATENHFRRFWERRMRRELVLHLAAGGEGLSPIALAAARRLDEGTVSA
ncbi:MAG: formate dehydrogenase subunit delta [Alphaproteobacteria bacterium]